ncbi:MAG: response regulator [Proteobacteria bacterium]|nr:response regulator [Pseudomonadota bacterium]
MRILIVDDEVAICQRLQRELQKEGHQVDYQTSPLGVLEELKKARRAGNPFNLLLLNVTMPEMTGLTLFARIREARLGVEAVIMTGYRDEQTVIEAIRLSVKDYLNKPVSLEELDQAMLRTREAAIERSNNYRKHHILVVDDEPDLCQRIRRELEKDGYCAAAAFSPEECLDHFSKNRVDVLVTDVKMPGMTGLEMLERCQEINTDFAAIIITGHGDHDVAIKSLRSGVYDYLKKPLSLAELIASVKKGIERLDVSRALAAAKETAK